MPSRFEQYTTHRQSRRLDDWDYTQAAAYFVTICTRDRVCLFGEVETGRMGLNRYGRIAAEEWRRTANLRDSVALDAFIVMPNHVHGIIVIQTDGNGGPDVPRGDTARRVAYCHDDGWGRIVIGPAMWSPTGRVVGHHRGRIQIGRHPLHQSTPGRIRRIGLAAQLPRPHHPE